MGTKYYLYFIIHFYEILMGIIYYKNFTFDEYKMKVYKFLINKVTVEKRSELNNIMLSSFAPVIRIIFLPFPISKHFLFQQ